AAGAAVVHDHDVVARTQRGEQGEVVIARLRGRVAGAALGGDPRPGRGPRRGVGVVLEVDPDGSRHCAARVERTLENRAPRGSSLAAMQGELADGERAAV